MTPSSWASNYRILPQGKWSFERFPWLKSLHDDPHEFLCVQKGAQVGITELALNRVFFNIDIKGIDCLYVLPSKTPDAKDFSTSRFDVALELSPHLMKMFSETKNIGHKRAGNTNLYIRGSKSRSGLKSIPVGLVVLDELDEHNQDNISLAIQRTSGQQVRQIMAISTPTIEDKGINTFYKESTQEHFMFKCPCCSRFTELTFPDCLEITAELHTDPAIENSFYKCSECKGRLEHNIKYQWLRNAEWIPMFKQRPKRGCYISQLYSSAQACRPGVLASNYLESLNDPVKEQEFYNSNLGLPHIVQGACVSEEDVEACIRNDLRKWSHGSPNHLITMGIDVGKYLHYEIDKWTLPDDLNNTIDINLRCRPQVLNEGKVTDYRDLDRLFDEFNVTFGIIDAQPDYRSSYEFACRHPGRVRLCRYIWHVEARQIETPKEDERVTYLHEPTVNVNRTSFLDLSLGRFRSRGILLPADVSHEYKTHVRQPVRRYYRDEEGKTKAKYVSAKDDHFAHARNYAEIALPFGISRYLGGMELESVN